MHFISILAVFSFLLTSCSTHQKSKSRSSGEISLKADRSHFDKYRSEVPKEKKEENDFLALVLKDMVEVRKAPAQVRESFYTQVRRTREAFQREQRKTRENFSREEKVKREKYLKELKDKRDWFVKTKPDSQKSREFFQDQNNQRLAFFETLKDERKDFELYMDDKKKAFDEDLKMKIKTFDDALREYQGRYDDSKKKNNRTGAASLSGEEAYPGQFRDLEDLKK